MIAHPPHSRGDPPANQPAPGGRRDTATLETSNRREPGSQTFLVSGCLVDGRGFAATREGGIGPGHRYLPPGIGVVDTVEVRVIGRRKATNRPGAAEFLNRSIQTVNNLASPKGRAEGSGFPTNIGTEDGQEWYALSDLRAFQARHTRRITSAGWQPRSRGVVLDGDPDELITAVEFYTAAKIPPKTWTKYVDMSKPAWQRHEDGYLPKPDLEEPVVKGRGMTRYWKRGRAQQWINGRTGPNPSPGRAGRAATPAADTASK